MASTSGTKAEGGPLPRTASRRVSKAPTMVVPAAGEDQNSLDSRFHAFGKAHRMDPTSSGRGGVHQFKTYLLLRLEREEEETQPQLARNGPREIQKFYPNFYEKNIRDGHQTKKP
ncbi:hypothetical protein RND71_012874 [Anisodus tanguticus]|uniref:Uncharacterized protein n=1 Tax=Anisodus tanguticus TaxID=243964 RepID=A0AAE1VHD9_9SOLA|nr:hypothetical protein RND71_012874 [Anisodus tanguticus]